MGEYITKQGIDYKIGTCESLYYTTYLELKRVNDLGLTKANDYLKVDNGFLFRFPFPDEDHIEQFGKYIDFDRGVLIKVPKEIGVKICHGETFYRTDKTVTDVPPLGFSLPCIMSDKFPLEARDWHSAREQTIFEIVQQKYVTDERDVLQVVVRCPYCGARSRLDYKEIKALSAYVKEYSEWFTDLQQEIVAIALQGYENMNDLGLNINEQH